MNKLLNNTWVKIIGCLLALSVLGAILTSVALDFLSSILETS
jgi:hypothetical protein